MDFSLVTKETLCDRIVSRLRADWVIFAGDVDAIEELEKNVYTPGTRRSALLELFIPPGGFPFMMGKRTPELRDYLHGVPDLDKTVLLVFSSKMAQCDDDKRKVSETLHYAFQVYRNADVCSDYSFRCFAEHFLSGGFL